MTYDKTVRIYVSGKDRSTEQVEKTIESKSSITRMMEEFHKNLPAAVNMKPTVSEEESTAYESTNFQMSPHPVRKKADTVTSRTSMWSANISVASFDYHDIKSELPRRSRRKSKKESLLNILDKKNVTLKRLIETTNNNGYEPVGYNIVASTKGTLENEGQTLRFHGLIKMKRQEINDVQCLLPII